MNWKKLFTRNAEDAPRVNLAGAQSLFGSIGANPILPTSASFIPIDGQGGTLDLLGNGVGPQWLGLQNKSMQWWSYNYCTPLASVIDRLAEADTNGILQILDADGKKVKNYSKVPVLSRIMKLMKRPNPLQTWEEFNSQQIVISKIFGYCPVFCVGPVGMDKTYTKSMWNINPYFIQPQRNTDFDMMNPDTPGTIKIWSLTIFGRTYSIPDEDILLIKDGFVDATIPDMGLPISKIAGLDFAISNICAAMEADNVLLKKKGPLGVFSYDQKPDMAGLIPMMQEDKDALQDDLRRYGLTVEQLQYVISKSPIKWNPISFNARDLMTKETARAGIDMICDRFSYPAELMSGKNATYENRSSAEKYLYQSNIQPFSLRRMARYDCFFGLIGMYNFYMEYNHLAVMQEDIMQAGQAYKAEAEGLDINWKAGIITFNEYRKRLELDEVAGFDIYYSEYIKKYPLPLPPSPPIQKPTPTK